MSEMTEYQTGVFEKKKINQIKKSNEWNFYNFQRS